MVRLSIIIPAAAEASVLEDTLVSVLSNRPADCEILVPHAASYADPYALAGEVEFLELPARTPAPRLISQAVDRAEGRVVHLLSPGCEVRDRWCEAALARFDEAEVGSVSPLIVDDWEQAMVISAGVGRRWSGRRVEMGTGLSIDAAHWSALKVVGPSSRAAFYRRESLQAVGGWPVCVGASWADLDVALSLREAGYQHVVEPSAQVALRQATTDRCGAFGEARGAARLFWRHGGGVAGWLVHPAAAVVQCLAAGGPLRIGAAMLGKLASCCDIAAGRAHRRLVQRVRAARLALTTSDELPSGGPDDHPARQYREAA